MALPPPEGPQPARESPAPPRPAVPRPRLEGGARALGGRPAGKGFGVSGHPSVDYLVRSSRGLPGPARRSAANLEVNPDGSC